MTDRETTLERLREARDGFWFSLGAYALLTEEPASTLISRYEVRVSGNSLVVVPRDNPPEVRETGYSIAFGAALKSGAALSVVERSFRTMIIDSFEITQSYCKANRLMHELKHQEWFWFAFHLRNAMAHGGIWDFTSDKGLPATWRRMTIERELQGHPVREFLGWFNGLQLGSVMTNFVDKGQ